MLQLTRYNSQYSIYMNVYTGVHHDIHMTYIHYMYVMCVRVHTCIHTAHDRLHSYSLQVPVHVPVYRIVKVYNP